MTLFHSFFFWLSNSQLNACFFIQSSHDGHLGALWASDTPAYKIITTTSQFSEDLKMNVQYLSYVWCIIDIQKLQLFLLIFYSFLNHCQYTSLIFLARPIPNLDTISRFCIPFHAVLSDWKNLVLPGKVYDSSISISDGFL